MSFFRSSMYTKPCGVHAADVAGAQPIAEHHLLGLIRPIPVAAHDLRPEHADLADAVHRQFLAGIVADRDIGRGNRQADGAVEIEAGRIGGGDRRGFGQPPPLRHDAAGHLLPAGGDHALHAPCRPQSVMRSALKSTVSKPGVCSRALNSVLTPLMKLNLYFFSSATNALKSRGFVINTLRAPKRQEGEAIAGERKDVIERQRGDDDARFVGLERGSHPGGRLQHVGDHVAVGENGGLGDAGGAARVLQEGDVLAAQGRPARASVRVRCPKRALEGRRARHVPVGYLLAHVACSTKFTMKPRGKPSRSPMRVTSTFFRSVCGSTCCSTCAKFSTMTMAFAPESFSWCSSSRAVYSGLVLTTTMPARSTPNSAIGYCRTLGIMSATRSPWPKPGLSAAARPQTRG